MPLNIPCYYKGLFVVLLVFVLTGFVTYVIIKSPAPHILKIFVSSVILGALLSVLLWVPKESHIQVGGVLLVGLVRRKFIEGEVVEEYSYDEVKRRLSFVPVGNRIILQCFFWGLYGSFQRRSGEWVSVDVYAGRDCMGRWLLVRKRGQDRYLLVCPGNV
ncbi:hypothetical protein Pogu_1947 [Pyrobaculum oguniense TE7]|uniref:Uncharacterized protein n=1 Tax=Pyrobaculum oguniense (strain DSM 13380 / JCM 10595 / TE7) TaxID=698757 RepID=H6QCK6_PYROT|nr:hypothetical protein Pogu_1947 [Pyrobaculum oguniense TE7]